MMLYELALELGVRSTVLLDRAHALGLHVDQTTALTADQVEQLRAAYGRGRGTASDAPVVDLPGLSPASGDKPIGTPAVVAMVAAGLVVVLLVGYVLTNSGDSETVSSAAPAAEAEASTTTATTEPCDDTVSGIGVGAIGQGDGAAPADAEGGSGLPPCSVAGGLSADVVEGTDEPDTRDPLDIPRNEPEFCKAALSVMEFEERLLEAALDVNSLAPMRDVMIGGRDRWKSDIVVMIATGPPRLDVPLEGYRVMYTNFLDSATPDADDYELYERFSGALRTDAAFYISQINQAIDENCSHR